MTHPTDMTEEEKARWFTEHGKRWVKGEVAEVKEPPIKKCPQAAPLLLGETPGVIRDVPLSMIIIPEVERTESYDNAYRLLKERGSIPPIALYWETAQGKFGIDDGIHRTNATRDLGYNCIPAIMKPSEAKRLEVT